MTDGPTFQAKVERGEANLDALNSVINGDNATDVTLPGGRVSPSLLKLFKNISLNPNSRAFVRLATAAVLSGTPTYANGTSGLGATLTAASNGALSVDGVTANNGDRILVTQQVAQLQNGPYVVTDKGSGGTPYVLTRAVDADTADDLTPGIIIGVMAGSTNGGDVFVLSTPASGSITVGTTAIAFSVTAATLMAAGDAAALVYKETDISADHTVTDSDVSTRLEVSGGHTIAFPDPTTLANVKHATDVLNVDAARRTIVDLHGVPIWVFPGQTAKARRNGSAWRALDKPGRWFQKTAINTYVDPNGSDTSNDFLGSGTSNAAQSVLAAWTMLQDYTDGPAQINLLASATFPAQGEMTGDRSGGYGRLIAISGDHANPPTILCGASEICISFRDGAWAQVFDVQFGASGSGSIGAQLTQKSLCDFSSVAWLSMVDGYHLFIDDGSDVNLTGPQSINGNSQAHWRVSGNSKLIVGSTTIDGNSFASSFSVGFAVADASARIILQSPTFANCGSITGYEAIVQRHSTVILNGHTLPGSASPSVDATSNVY